MDFDKMIADKKQEKVALIEKMESKKEEILSGLATFAEEWYEKVTISSIKDNSAIVFSLGVTRASEMKDKINSLKRLSREVVNNYANVDGVWWHEKENKFTYSGSRSKIHSELEQPARLIFGELGEILMHYGITGTGSYSHAWEKGKVDGKLEYGYGIEYPERLIGLSNSYIELIGEGKRINDELVKIEEKKKRENIEEWWSAL